MALLHSTLFCITLTWLYLTLLDLHYSTMAVLHSSLHYSTMALYFTPHYSTMTLSLLDSTLLYHGSIYFTRFDSTLLYHGSASLYLSLQVCTMALLHFT